MIPLGYGYFSLLAAVAAAGVVVPIRHWLTASVYDLAVKSLPGIVLAGYAFQSTTSGLSSVWLAWLGYHVVSAGVVIVVMIWAARSPALRQRIERRRDGGQAEKRQTTMLRRVYGASVYLVQLALWYLTFGT